MADDERPDWDEIWMNVAREVARRSRCVRQYGAVIVDAHNVMVSVGYNGPPASLIGTEEGMCVAWCPHATEDTTKHTGYGTCVSIHCEINALMRSSRRDREGGTIYVTGLSCWDCAKAVSNSGLKRIVQFDDKATYRRSAEATNLLIGSGLDVYSMYA